MSKPYPAVTAKSLRYLAQIHMRLTDPHVGTSDYDVLRAAYARQRKAAFPFTRAQRRTFYKACLKIHASNRALYRAVTRGY